MCVCACTLLCSSCACFCVYTCRFVCMCETELQKAAERDTILKQLETIHQNNYTNRPRWLDGLVTVTHCRPAAFLSVGIVWKKSLSWFPHCVWKTLATNSSLRGKILWCSQRWDSVQLYIIIGAAAVTLTQEMMQTHAGLDEWLWLWVFITVSDSPHCRRIRRSGRGRSRSAGSPSRWWCSTYREHSGHSSDRPRSACRDTGRRAGCTHTRQGLNRPEVPCPPSNTYTLHRREIK